MKPEAKLWQQLRPFFLTLGQVNRIESGATRIGVPDVELGLKNGNQWWVELKVEDFRKGIVMRPAQKMWHTQRYKMGGKSLVLVKFLDGAHALYWGDNAAGIGAKQFDGYFGWYDMYLYHWTYKIDYEQFKDFLYETKRR